MNSAIAAVIGLTLAILLIIRKVPPVFSLMLGALAGGLLAGWGLPDTVTAMVTGVKDICPAIIRILAAGVLTGALIQTGSADAISRGIIKVFGERRAYFAIALSAMILCAAGVFVDVSVITVAPIVLITARKTGLPLSRLLFSAIAGAKCGNMISPNPNTIIAADNYGAPLSSVMAANILPAIVALLVSVLLIVRIVPGKKTEPQTETIDEQHKLPSFVAAIVGPLTAILLLALRPICGVTIDPMAALPAGGIICILATRQWRQTGECLRYGLEKMSSVAVLLVATGTLAGIIKESTLSATLISWLSGWHGAEMLMAPVSSILMAAATASTTAGATISSSSFSAAVLATGLSPVWAAAMTNAGATVIDQLPHGSFFHTTGGSVEMSFRDRLRLVPFEALCGLTLTAVCCLMAKVVSLF